VNDHRSRIGIEAKGVCVREIRGQRLSNGENDEIVGKLDMGIVIVRDHCF